ncbi:phosphotriesterase family protein [Algoriphagus hitonicola]|uniref:Phosphotriesterase-related protein n=1 Tax=Algoriphagus hitonicola TaxID=435880 RepID=A0A1I2P8D2_9BACT|nr:phosphotriesterase [Algoriphagus hitonicola]SFG11740.1 phosphotriesterase-related protein [Algoriphagus hitonicola]
MNGSSSVQFRLVVTQTEALGQKPGEGVDFKINPISPVKYFKPKKHYLHTSQPLFAMKNFLGFLLLVVFAFSCTESQHEKEISSIETVTGPISIDSLGLTLIHEHLLVDFIGADSVSLDRWDRDSVVQKVLPYLMEVKKFGVKTILECTPSFLGKDPILLQQLSEKSGIQILTNTGYYGAVEGKYLPAHAFSETAEQLSERWIAELENGIGETGIKPAFIKISVNESELLSPIDQKLVKAAGLTHQKSGLTIASHTGTWKTAAQEVTILQEMEIDPSAFVWVHAQAEEDFQNYQRAADLGVWISLDGIGWRLTPYVDRLIYAKENGFLDQVLISHDAGWYDPSQAGGGEFQPFTNIFEELIPILNERGFSREDWNQLLIENPKQAFGGGL